MVSNINSNKLTEHFFRKEYGKLVSVVSSYLGHKNVITAEDIVQETLLKATEKWAQNGVPENPTAWLYKTAKNLTINILQKEKRHRNYTPSQRNNLQSELTFESHIIKDEQLRMIFLCCHPSLHEASQIALVLKILCGFSQNEIALAFFSNTETINKRLVRGRKKLNEHYIKVTNKKELERRLPAVLKTLYMLFNEGYHPSQKSEVVRVDLCFEAIRLGELIVDYKSSFDKSEIYALLALMYLNVSKCIKV